MAAPPVQAVLQNVGDVCGPIQLGSAVFPNQADGLALYSFTGAYSGVIIALEAIPDGQPMNAPVSGQLPTPVSSSSWTALQQVGISGGAQLNSPVGPIASAGGPNTGNTYTTAIGPYQQARARLLQNTGGTPIMASIATGPVAPGAPPVQATVNPAASLELGRLRVGVSILLEGMGINLQDLTAADIQAFS